jgi:GTPase
MRHVSLPGVDKVILSDTVGFVSDLPTQLVAAFRATLEEVVSADLIIHVRDIAHPDSEAQAADVEAVLNEIGAQGDGAAPMIEAWNKADLLDDDVRAALIMEAARRDDVAVISALSGGGIADFSTFVGARLTKAQRVRSVSIDAGQGRAIAWLRAHGKVVEERLVDDRYQIEVRLSDEDWARYQSRDFA